jgi:hypothetical protein
MGAVILAITGILGTLLVVGIILPGTIWVVWWVWHKTLTTFFGDDTIPPPPRLWKRKPLSDVSGWSYRDAQGNYRDKPIPGVEYERVIWRRCPKCKIKMMGGSIYKDGKCDACTTDPLVNSGPRKQETA